MRPDASQDGNSRGQDTAAGAILWKLRGVNFLEPQLWQ